MVQWLSNILRSEPIKNLKNVNSTCKKSRFESHLFVFFWGSFSYKKNFFALPGILYKDVWRHQKILLTRPLLIELKNSYWCHYFEYEYYSIFIIFICIWIWIAVVCSLFTKSKIIGILLQILFRQIWCLFWTTPFFPSIVLVHKAKIFGPSQYSFPTKLSMKQETSCSSTFPLEHAQ